MDVDALLTGNLTQNLKSIAMTSRMGDICANVVYSTVSPCCRLPPQSAVDCDPLHTMQFSSGANSSGNNAVLCQSKSSVESFWRRWCAVYAMMMTNDPQLLGE